MPTPQPIDPFHIDPKAQLAPGITYQDALDQAAMEIAKQIDREVLETLRKKNAGSQLQSNS
jgi:hypothetical protein